MFIMWIHYAHRYPSISHYFGLLDSSDELIGVVTFGSPASPPLRAGMFSDKSIKILELNRLVLKYNRKNEASFLVGNALKMLPQCAVISFADTERGHIGTVYQACNFLYCGLSAVRTDWKVRGLEHLHGVTLADEFRGFQGRSVLMREKYGADFYLKERYRKHRYVFFVGSKGFRKQCHNALNYKTEEYPRGSGERHVDAAPTMAADKDGQGVLFQGVPE
jgi:hypothetical protein